MKNTVNMVTDQVLLDECAIHFPEILPLGALVLWQTPHSVAPFRMLDSELSVQQGDISGTLLFALVLHKVVLAIALSS